MLTLLLAVAVWAAQGAEAPAAAGGLRAVLDARQSMPLALKDLGPEWRTLRITRRTSAESQAQGLLGYYNRAMGPETDTGPFYSRGQTVSESGHRYLVTLRAHPRAPELAKLMNRSSSSVPPVETILDAVMPRARREDALDLALIDIGTISSIQDSGPFDLERATTERSTPGGTAPIMAAILFPVFAQARQKARETSSLSNLKQIGLATAMYAQDHDEALPPLNSVAAARKALMPYVKVQEVFVQPGTGESYHVNPAASGKRTDRLADPSHFILMYEAAPAADGSRGVLFADGHAGRVTAAEWARLKLRSHLP